MKYQIRGIFTGKVVFETDDEKQAKLMLDYHNCSDYPAITYKLEISEPNAIDKDKLRAAMGEIDKQHNLFSNKLAELQGDNPFRTTAKSAEEKLTETAFDAIIAAEKAMCELFAAITAIETHNQFVVNGIVSLV